jgi:hypothetical protein
MNEECEDRFEPQMKFLKKLREIKFELDFKLNFRSLDLYFTAWIFRLKKICIKSDIKKKYYCPSNNLQTLFDVNVIKTKNIVQQRKMLRVNNFSKKEINQLIDIQNEISKIYAGEIFFVWECNIRPKSFIRLVKNVELEKIFFINWIIGIPEEELIVVENVGLVRFYNCKFFSEDNHGHIEEIHKDNIMSKSDTELCFKKLLKNSGLKEKDLKIKYTEWFSE